MPVTMMVYTGVRFLHDLATAVWIGGLAAMTLAVLPAAKGLFGPGPRMRQLVQAVQKRLKVLVYASIVVLIATGVLMSRRSPQFTGFLSWATPYSAVLAWKHLLVLLMIAAVLLRSLVSGRPVSQPVPSLDDPQGSAGRPTGAETAPRMRDRIGLLLLFLNLALGAAVLLLSALSTSLSTIPPA